LANGFFNVDKPLGLTSHDVVAKVRRVYKQHTGSQKVGHAGTLDPLATGVLVVCVGHATRLSDYVMHTTKRYRATVTLGVSTETYDAEGRITAQNPVDHLSQADVEALFPTFTGHILQVPPMYSAIKKDGKKLYELARAGETVELEPRSVYIERLEVLSWQEGVFVLDVVCGAGTYIRSLAHDIGAMLGVGAHLSGLVRVASGSFTLENAVSLDVLLEGEAWRTYLISPLDGLAQYPRLALLPEEAHALRNGQVISQRQPMGDGLVLGILDDGYLLAILAPEGEWLKPHKVFLP